MRITHHLRENRAACDPLSAAYAVRSLEVPTFSPRTPEASGRPHAGRRSDPTTPGRHELQGLPHKARRNGAARLNFRRGGSFVPAMPPSRSPRRPTRVLSVGTKLAAATTGLVLVVAACVYVALGRYERENLFRTKEAAASAVTSLFADSSAAAIAFTDEDSIKEELAGLGHNREVEYAAVWSVSEEGKLEGKLGELRRGAPETPSKAPPALRLVRAATRVTVFSPVHEPGGRTIGVAAVAFSLAAENAAVAAVGKRTLGISAGISIGLTLMLLIVARFTIIRPLRKLVKAAKELENGRVTDIDVHSKDEIGQLASAFRSMVAAISSREEHIGARNRDMRLLLDNVDQGFITIDIEG